MAAIGVSVTGDGASDWIQSLVLSLPIFVPRLDLPGRHQPVRAISVSKFVDRIGSRPRGVARPKPAVGTAAAAGAATPSTHPAMAASAATHRLTIMTLKTIPSAPGLSRVLRAVCHSVRDRADHGRTILRSGLKRALRGCRQLGLQLQVSGASPAC